MSGLIEFERRVAESWPPESWHGVSVLVAVSGGADSVALLRAVKRLKDESRGAGHLIVGHVNHRLRTEADRDESFVRALSSEIGLTCEVAALEPAQFDLREGMEAAARQGRYEALTRIAQRHGARYVATAHTADDQAETILHRIVRGTGLPGLAGIPRVRALSPAVTLVRPILGIQRRDMLAYLHDLGQSFCDDATNAELHFTRNRIRHELLPLLRQFNPQIHQSLVRLGGLAAEAQAVIDSLAEELHDRCVRLGSSDQVVVDCQGLRREPRYLVRELFIRIWRSRGWSQQAMGYEEWDRLADMAHESADGQHVLPGNIVARRSGDEIRLST